MSVLGDLDGMILREVVNPPLPTKNAELTLAEWDDRVVAMYNAFQDIVSGVNVEAYDPSATYDGTSSDVYEKFAGYGGRIWQAVFAGAFSGQTPAEGIYWTQVTLAQLLPNVLKLAEVASGPPCQCVRNSRVILDAADIAALNTAPMALTPTPSGTEYIEPIAINVMYTHGGSSFTGGGAMLFLIANAAGPIASLADIIQATSSKHGRAALLSSGSDSQYVAGEPLTALTLAGPTGGNGSMIINTLYVVRSTLAVM
jgi:hypothetical protein